MNKEQKIKRSPVVVVMGHVNHGKTKLLDYIRKTNIAAKEAGGITQSIGAYEITHNDKRITFIDTPGHEAFSKMRNRGAKIADIAILVVAVDDSVQPQTKEAIKIIEEAKIPYIVALNKIDKPGIDINKVKNDLLQAGVLLEGYGGNISCQPISAKFGQGVNELLDLILLTSEVEGLNYSPKNQAQGFILESQMDSRRGVVASVILKDGILKAGDEIAAGEAWGKIKILENFLGEPTEEIIPSSPARVLGFNVIPRVGEIFYSGKSVKELIVKTKKTTPVKKLSQKAAEEEQKKIKLILKGDVSGSVETLSGIIKNLPQQKEFNIEIIDEEVGEITDGDVKLAVAADAIIISFKAGITRAAENLARAQGIKIVRSDVIYELTKAVEEEIKGLKKEIILGDLEILAVFGKRGAAKQIVGGRIVSGSIKNNAILEIWRKDEIIGKAKVLNLQKEKKDVAEATEGECGLLADSETMIQVGDHLLMK
jgi:translation initiation factor IF-2